MRFLVIMALSFLVLQAPAWAETVPHKVCFTKDFATFATEYSKLSADEQASCFGASFDNDGSSEKLIISEEDTRLNDLMPTTPYMGPPDTLTGGADHYGYIIQEDNGPDKKSMALTEGGTFIFQVVHFAWNGQSWQAIGITDKGFHDDE